MKSMMFARKLAFVAAAGISFSSLLSCSTVSNISDKVFSTSSSKNSEDSRYEIETLANGLRIFYVNDSSLPRLGMRALFKVGSKHDPIGKEGLTNLTGDLLTLGAGKWNATELAEQVSDLGSELGVVTGAEMTSLEMDCIDKDREKMIEVFKTILTAPSFKESEIQRAKKATLSQIHKKQDSPDVVVGEEIDKMVFGETHPYGRSTLGDPKIIRNFSRKDFIGQYFKYFRPNNMSLAVSGNVTPEVRKIIRDSFSTWSSKETPELNMQPLKMAEGRELKVISKAGLEQTQIRMGHQSVTRKYSNYHAYKLALEILGGGFESRLNSQIRNKLGLTYSIESDYEPFFQSGKFSIATFTKHATVYQTVSETLKLYEQFVAEGVTQKELDDAKAQLLGNFPRIIETADRYAGNLVILDFYGVELNYLAQYNRKVKAVTLEEVNQIIKNEFKPQNLKIAIYTDKSKLKDQLVQLNSLSKP